MTELSPKSSIPIVLIFMKHMLGDFEDKAVKEFHTMWNRRVRRVYQPFHMGHMDAFFPISLVHQLPVIRYSVLKMQLKMKISENRECLNGDNKLDGFNVDEVDCILQCLYRLVK